jgi:DNA (cytosine-5)-methyltransferase 1
MKQIIQELVSAPKKKLAVLDLFSGIGGFSLGLERTGGFETAAFCEIEPRARRVLAKHWPGVRCYDDVRTLTSEQLAADGIARIDVITGGFPCQDISLVGKQRGISDGTRSGLWSEIARLARELRPAFVIVENVANLLSGPSDQPGKWFGRVLGDLAELGYNAEWENIPAGAVGAPSRRERVWIVAYGDEGAPWAGRFTGRPNRQAHDWPRLVLASGSRSDNGFPDWVDRVGQCGNAVVPQIPELIGYAILESLNAQEAAA